MYNNHQYVEEQLVVNGLKKMILHTAVALLITFISIFSVVYIPIVTKFVENNSKRILSIICLFPVFISFFINRINTKLAQILYFFYTVLTGFALSYAVFKYGIGISLFSFVVAIGIFTLMSLFSYFTKEDLERYRVIIKLNLFFLIIVFLINSYYGVPILYWIVGYWTIITFTSLIGFDINHIKKDFKIKSGDIDSLSKINLTGVIQCYLDFFILSLALMTIFGKTFS